MPTLTLKCPDVICDPVHAGGPKNVPKFKSPLDVGGAVGNAINTVLQAFTGSPKQNLQWAIDGINATPLADLRQKDFLNIYRQIFGMAMAFLAPAILISLILIVFKNRAQESPTSKLTAGAKLFVIGTVLPGVVTVLLLGSQWLAKLFGETIQHLKLNNGAKLPSVGDAVTNFFVSIALDLSRVMVLAEAVPIQMSIYLFVLLGILAAAIWIGKGEVNTPVRWLAAAVVTGVFLQPVLVLILGLGGSIAISYPSDTGKALSVLMLFFICLLAPILMFHYSNRGIETFVRNHQLQVAGDVNAQFAGGLEQQSHDRQVVMDARFAAMGGGQSEHHGSFLGKLALVATGAALEPIVIAKVAGMAQDGKHGRAQAAYGAYTHVFNRHVPGGLNNPYVQPNWGPGTTWPPPAPPPKPDRPGGGSPPKPTPPPKRR